MCGTTGHRGKRLCLVMLAAGLALLSLWTSGAAQEIIGTLSNFDVHNADKRPYDEFALHILGRIEPNCIWGWYKGWGTPPDILAGSGFGDGIRVRWSDPDNPIEHCRTEHFGLVIDHEYTGPFAACAFWYYKGERVNQIPVPWQSWKSADGSVRGIIRLSAFFQLGPVLLEREFVTLPEEVILRDLMWDKVEGYVQEMGREWKRVDDRWGGIILLPGEEIVLDIPVTKEDGAVLVRYTVRLKEDPDRVLTRFINEAVIDWPIRCYPGLPDPWLRFGGAEEYISASGDPYTRYYLAILNWSDFPDELFTAAPDLPPCGLNPNASRTWVSIYSGDGTYQYGFCALSDSHQLDDISFAVPNGESPPECVYVELWDRRCHIIYQSDCISVGARCIDFEDPPLWSEYWVGDVFSDSGSLILVKPFQLENGTWTNTGGAKIRNEGGAGGQGQEVAVNSANLVFDFPFPFLPPNKVILQFGEYAGGNLNIEINGDFRNFADFYHVHGSTIGGVLVLLTASLGKGTIRLEGLVYDLAVGGVELVIDNVCIFW